MDGTSKTVLMNGADIIVDHLTKQKVPYLFGLCGHGITGFMDAAFKAATEHYAELSAKNANWKKVYEDYASFRRDANLWFRFTESGFDDFMQSQKL